MQTSGGGRPGRMSCKGKGLEAATLTCSEKSEGRGREGVLGKGGGEGGDPGRPLGRLAFSVTEMGDTGRFGAEERCHLTSV